MNFLVENKNWSIISQFQLEDKLTNNQIYSFETTPLGAMYLSEHNKFSLPEPLFDVDQNFRKLIITSYNHNTGNTGVLLSGMKGAGKTVCAKLLCEELGLPIILINKPIHRTIDFGSFLKKIDQNYILFVDEFEKHFKANPNSNDNDYHTQESFLSLMDGVGSTNKIFFLFTVNEEVNQYMINRPSRIRYIKKYNGISEELFNLITNQLLKNKDLYEDFRKNVTLAECTVDILISLIKELNIHNIPYSQFKDIFNFELAVTKYNLSKLVDKEYIPLGNVKNVRKYPTMYYIYDDVEDTTLPKEYQDENDKEGFYPELDEEFTILKKDVGVIYLRQNNNIFKLESTFDSEIKYVF